MKYTEMNIANIIDYCRVLTSKYQLLRLPRNPLTMNSCDHFNGFHVNIEKTWPASPFFTS